MRIARCWVSFHAIDITNARRAWATTNILPVAISLSYCFLIFILEYYVFITEIYHWPGSFQLTRAHYEYAYIMKLPKQYLSLLLFIGNLSLHIYAYYYAPVFTTATRSSARSRCCQPLTLGLILIDWHFILSRAWPSPEIKRQYKATHARFAIPRADKDAGDDGFTGRILQYFSLLRLLLPIIYAAYRLLPRLTHYNILLPAISPRPMPA